MIQVDRLGVRAGRFELAGVSFAVPAGQHACLMGRTGSGKTTLLEAICGLRAVTGGQVRLDGREVVHLAPGDRGIGLVPQDRALFEHLTVREHLAFALAVRRWSAPAVRERVEELAHWLQLDHLLDRRPAGLSGGEAQRVALGRALAFRPTILCLDEPLSALDDDMRAEVREVLRSVRHHARVTILHVTHNLADARDLADQILVLRGAQVVPVAKDALGT
ncbi:MAG: ATP-binding cassette domain-containing protein [Verrucomicrobia bacterium]|nr:ATP-binding cassette domain-containing protein [Verrucomicrobiota bacterium]